MVATAFEMREKEMEPAVESCAAHADLPGAFQTNRLFRALLRLAMAEGDLGHDSLKSWRDAAEASRIVHELDRCGGNRSAAARGLGIARRTLYCKMQKLGIGPQ